MSTETTRNYVVRVHREDDGSLWAEVIDLPGCFASGGTLDELWEGLGEALSLYLSGRVKKARRCKESPD